MKRIILSTVILILVFSLVISVPPLNAALRVETQPEIKESVVTETAASYGSDVLVTAGKDDSSVHLTWGSTSPDNDTVHWTETEKLIDGQFPASFYSVTAPKESTIRGYTARATITGLEPDTSYSYRIVSPAGTSKTYTLSTHKEDNAFSFLLAGDPQVGASGNDQDYEGWARTIDKATEWFGDEVEFLMSAGDQVNSHNISRQYKGFASSDWLREHPIVTTVGNHDNGYGYSQYVTYTGVDQNTTASAGVHGGDYWIEYDGVLIMSLNINDTSVATHRAFMENAIAEFTEAYGEPLWTIVTFHFSIYTAGARAYRFIDLRNTLGVTMSELGVDAVLSGHDHVYTRAYMINGTEIIDDADLYSPVGEDAYGSYRSLKEGDILYLTVNSASGSKFYDLYGSNLPYAAVANQENVPNITKVDVTPDSLVFTTYRTAANNTSEDVLDFFAIHRETSEDKYAPIFTVPSTTYYSVGDEVDLYSGVSAYDNVDGYLTDKIIIEGNLDVTKPTVLTYKITDSSGNTAVKKCTFIPLETQKVVSSDKTVWKYLDTCEDIYGDNDDRESWKTLEFDDSTWKEGYSGFGAVEGELGEHDGFVPATHISQYFPEGHDDEGYNIPCFFFRTTFDLKDPEKISMLKAKIYYNDACSIYINGVLVKDFNIAVNNRGDVIYNGNPASGMATPGDIFINDAAAIESFNLKEKDNVIAVMLYQFSSGYEGDIFFHFDYLEASANGTEFPYTDVKTSAWYYQSVTRAVAKGLFVGTSDTKFSPNGTMTRAMTWAVLSRIAGEDIGASEGKWYKGYQSWATANGVSDGTYPNKNITREQLVSMLYRLSGEPAVEGSLESFADSGKVSSWAKDAMIWAVNEGLIVGRNGNTLAPKANATRAEGSVLLLKYLEI